MSFVIQFFSFDNSVEIWGFHDGEIQVEVFWVVDLWNVGILPLHYTASQPKRPWIFTAVKASNLASGTSIGTLQFTLHPEDWDNDVLRNVGILPQHYTAPQPRRPRLESSPLWKPQISHVLNYTHRRKFLLPPTKWHVKHQAYSEDPSINTCLK
jgi:hypothetical protein